MTVEDVAARLLDAQVDWIVGELTGPQLADLLAHDVDDLLRIGTSVPFGALVERESLKRVVRRSVSASGDSALVTAMVDAIADAVYALPAADEHGLGTVIPREHVDALITKLLAMRQLHDQAMDRMAQSPAVADIAQRFVGQLVNDIVTQNREKVERLPGAKSMMSLGLGAAKRVRAATADTFIGEAAGRGAQFAVKRTNAVTRDLLRDAPLREAALEVWDLQAAETIGALREYASAADVREIAQLVRAIIADARDTEYAAALLDACVDAIFDAYGDTDVTTLLGDLGLGRPELLFAVQQVAPRLLTTLHEHGQLDGIVRSRLAPFFAGDAVRAILADPAATAPAKQATTTARKAPVKKAATKKAAAKKAPTKKATG
ncbi:hypothetical protein [Jatrophihabitans endophyticus]|nr:hypothetical protein [Jatrophihabitans endophyticus]